LFISVYCI